MYSDENLKKFDQTGGEAFVNAFIQGATEYIPAVMEAIPISFAQLSKPDKRDYVQHKDMEEIKAEFNRWFEASKKITESDLYQMGGKVREFIKDTVPVEVHQQGGWQDELGHGLGIAAGGMGIYGLAAKGAGKAGAGKVGKRLTGASVTSAAFFSLGASHGFKDAIQKGATLEQALDHAVVSGFIEAGTEYLALKRMFKLMNKAFGDRKARKVVARIVEATSINVLQEVVAETLNSLDQHLRGIDEYGMDDIRQAKDAGIIGGGVGLIIQGIAELAGGVMNRRLKSRSEPKAEVQEPVETIEPQEPDEGVSVEPAPEPPAPEPQPEPQPEPVSEPLEDESPMDVDEDKSSELNLGTLVGKDVNYNGMNGKIVKKKVGEDTEYMFRPEMAQGSEEFDLRVDPHEVAEGHTHTADVDYSVDVDYPEEPDRVENVGDQQEEARDAETHDTSAQHVQDTAVQPDRADDSVQGAEAEDKPRRTGRGVGSKSAEKLKGESGAESVSAPESPVSKQAKDLDSYAEAYEAKLSDIEARKKKGDETALNDMDDLFDEEDEVADKRGFLRFQDEEQFDEYMFGNKNERGRLSAINRANLRRAGRTSMDVMEKGKHYVSNKAGIFIDEAKITSLVNQLNDRRPKFDKKPQVEMSAREIGESIDDIINKSGLSEKQQLAIKNKIKKQYYPLMRSGELDADSLMDAVIDDVSEAQQEEKLTKKAAPKKAAPKKQTAQPKKAPKKAKPEPKPKSRVLYDIFIAKGREPSLRGKEDHYHTVNNIETVEDMKRLAKEQGINFRVKEREVDEMTFELFERRAREEEEDMIEAAENANEMEYGEEQQSEMESRLMDDSQFKGKYVLLGKGDTFEESVLYDIYDVERTTGLH